MRLVTANMLRLLIFTIAGSFLFPFVKPMTSCEDGWLAYSGSCYLLATDTYKFVEAEHFCRQHYGSHLIHVNNELENNFIKQHLREISTHGAVTSHWFMGLTDETVEGDYRWTDTHEPATFTDFKDSDHAHDGEDCFIFANDYDFKWADVPCSTWSGHPLCEMESERFDCSHASIVGK